MSEREERQRRLRESAQRAFKYGVELEERKRVCTKAFEDPAGRKIATEDIAEGLFWRMYDAIKWGQSDLQRKTLLSTLNVQEPENG